MNPTTGKPLSILLFGGNVDARKNKGDALMMLAVIAKLREAFPDAELVARRGAGPYVHRARLGLFQLLFHSKLLSKRRLAAWIIARYRDEFGIRTDADLSAVLNFQGYRFADFGWREVRQDWEDFRRRRRTGARHIYLPQAFGPFERPDVRDRVAEMLNGASLVYARDARSAEFLREIGVSSVRQCPDMTIGFPDDLPDEPQAGIHRRAQGRTVYLIPNCWMLSRAGLQQDEALAFYAAAIARIQEKCASSRVEVRFLNHSPVQDAPVIQTINARLVRPVEVADEPDPVKMKYLVRDALFVFGSRYHSLVAALSQNVPAIGTSWAPKYEGLFSDYDTREWLLPGRDALDQLNQLLETLFDPGQYQSVVARLVERNAVLKRSVASMWDSVCSVLSGEAAPRATTEPIPNIPSRGLPRQCAPLAGVNGAP